MFAILEPNLFSIPNSAWSNPSTRDTLLHSILLHDDFIQLLDDISIAWNDDLEACLWGTNAPPWTQTDWNVPLTEIFFIFLRRKMYYVTCNTNTCYNSVPNSLFQNHTPCATDLSLQILHQLNEDTKEYIYLASNTTIKPSNLDVICNTHNFETKLRFISNSKDWLNQPDLLKNIWLNFDGDINHLKILVAHYFEYLNLVPKLQFSCSDDFLTRIQQTDVDPSLLLKAITKRLSMDIPTAMRDGGLQDEKLKTNTHVRRFRVTEEWRIHYRQNGVNSISFDNYYGPGEHDDGL